MHTLKVLATGIDCQTIVIDQDLVLLLYSGALTSTTVIFPAVYTYSQLC